MSAISKPIVAKPGLLYRFRTMGRQAGIENMWGWLLVMPWLIGFLGFTLGPMIALGLSLIHGSGYFDAAQMGRSAQLCVHVYSRSGRTAFLPHHRDSDAFVSVPLRLVLGLAIVLLMNQKVRGIFVFRTIYYLPAVLSGVAVALLWRWVFNSEFGLVNTMLWRIFGIKGPAWLVNPQWVMSAFIVMSLWNVGGPMLIYLAGLQGIPTDLYEAAGGRRGRYLACVSFSLPSPS